MPIPFRLRMMLAAIVIATTSHPRPGHGEPLDRVAAAAAVAPPARQMDHLSVEVTGQGTPVILIPGLSIGREGWRATADRLRARHRVYLIEVNGFGGSAPGANLDDPILDGLVADLHRLIAADRLVAPAVIGHSMGGLVATMLAARHPGDVGRLMVVDALPWIGTIMAPAGATPATVASQAAAMRDRLAAQPRGDLPVTADPGGIWSATPVGRIQVANWSRTADPRVTSRAFYEDMTTDIGPDLGRVTARPFTVLYATGAGPMADRIWQAAYRGSPATLHPIADSYHFIMLDQPARFNMALDRFLGDANR